jgi:methyl-accepting chemotaxis protein
MGIASLRLGTKAARLAALELIRTNIMLADANLNITYLNRPLRSFMMEVERDLRKELPNFRVDTLIGSNIDIFHKNPRHQREILRTLTTTHSATIQIGPHVFDLLVVPLVRGSRRTGYLLEWADATERLKNIDCSAQIAAFSRAQAIIEFTPDGIIRNANTNFLGAMGYTLDEIVGKHHSIFMDRAEAATPQYQAFWKALADGAHQTGEFRRFHKSGKVIWIHGAYNPIPDDKGRIVKVVKFCVDVTKRVEGVNQIGSALNLLAQGKLTQRLDKPLLPELDQLRLDLNSAIDALDKTMKTVATTSHSVQSVTEEILGSANDLSRRTEQQAANLEQTAAALDQITATVKKAAEGARHARDVVRGAKIEAEKSGTVVQEAVQSMDGIESSSTKISQIIGVIDEIAFQTNLLALNAGVEAARAGEAGRGFAVVAQEVRALAQRSAEAAKEIKTLISTSTQQVAAGVSLVGQTGQALDRIINHVAEINTAVTEIAASAQEQSTTLTEINTAVNQMDRATQQNAAMVEETTAACHGLSNDARALSDLISAFDFTRDAAGAAVARRA